VASGLNMDRTYFERRYAESSDPWDFEHSWYEHRKYDLTVAALPERGFRRAFEPGCSIGVLSERLAARCDELVAMEMVPAAARTARERLRHLPGVSVREGAIPDSWPSGPFDLIVLSEIGYYLTDRGFQQTLNQVRTSLAPHGTLISVHYLLETDYAQTGRQVGMRLRDQPWLSEHGAYHERAFELLVFRT
jgi:cyclopropane fatty-acyl-phospholipid synthase-like methyltransferase